MIRLLPLLAAFTALFAPPALVAGVPAPRLVVVISVDQFSADLYAEYRGRFTAGLRRLGEGVTFPSGYQSHAATETCPGHSTILTGDRPARTGIIANYWFDLSLPRADKRVYCSEDPGVPGSSSATTTPSVGFLKVPTLGDRLKQASPASRVVSVAGKDRAAIMMGGHATDQMWFWTGRRFETLPGRTATPPRAVEAANVRAAAALARVDREPLPTECRGRARPIAVGPRTVGVPEPRAAGDLNGFRASPAFDRAIAGLGEGLLAELRLGTGPQTDLLIIGLSANDYVGHLYGTEGGEMCRQVLALDRTIGGLLAALDRSGVPYMVALTADHGGYDVPERNAARAVPEARRVDPALSPDVVSVALAREFGLEGTVLFGDAPFGDMYVARGLPAATRRRVLEAARARYLASPDVEAVFTADELARVPAPRLPPEAWTLAERFSQSFDPARSGDLLVALKPRIVPLKLVGGALATHGSPWDYDRRVPILFWWPGAVGYEQPNAVETIDILPTIAAAIGLPIAAGAIDGRCLDLDPGAASSCPPR